MFALHKYSRMTMPWLCKVLPLQHCSNVRMQHGHPCIPNAPLNISLIFKNTSVSFTLFHRGPIQIALQLQLYACRDANARATVEMLSRSSYNSLHYQAALTSISILQTSDIRVTYWTGGNMYIYRWNSQWGASCSCGISTQMENVFVTEDWGTLVPFCRESGAISSTRVDRHPTIMEEPNRKRTDGAFALE